MDIKKFITCEKFGADHNRLIQQEALACNVHSEKYKRSGTVSSNSNMAQSVHKVSEYDFFNMCVDMKSISNDPNINEFESLLKTELNKKKLLVYSGSMIKRYFDPNIQATPSENGDDIIFKVGKSTKTCTIDVGIENCYTVSIVDPSCAINVKGIFNNDAKNKIESKNGFYIIRLSSGTLMCVDKNPFQSIGHFLMSNTKYVNRVGLYDDEILVSSMFCIELHKRMTYYNSTSYDPVFGYPEDIMEIYDRTPTANNTIKHMIDTVDTDSLQEIDGAKIENTIIVHNSDKYTVIEYLIMKMIEKSLHPVIVYHMSNMVIYLHQFYFFRPPFLLASITGFNEMYPSLYETIKTMKLYCLQQKQFWKNMELNE